MSLSADMKTLIPGSIAATEDIYLNDMPDKPDNLVCIYQSGGSNPDYTLAGRDHENPTFQVRVRNTSPAVALDKVEALKDTFDSLVGVNINGNHYIWIRQQGDIMPLGKDTRNRYEYTINFHAKVRRNV